MSQQMLPEGWEAIPFLDTCQQISVARKKLKTSAYQSTGRYRVVDQGQDTVSGFSNDESLVVSVDKPVVVFGDHTRIVKWVPWDFVPGADGVKVLSPLKGVFPRFFYYFLSAVDIPDKGYSRHFKFLRECAVLLPPLIEQEVIAYKLDTLLTQVNNLKARLDAIPTILKRFRQSVLAAAVSGKLTGSTHIPFDSWGETTLESLLDAAFDGPFGSKLKTADYTESGVGVVRLENIKHLRFEDEKRTYISEGKYEKLVGNTLKKNDVLFSSFVDEEVRVCLFPFDRKVFINKADCFCLRADSEKILPRFLMFLLASHGSYLQIKNHVQGVTRPRVNLRILKSLSFKMPELDEQAEIVRRVDQLFAFADQVEKQVENAQSRVNRLTQSILAKAFRGELTAQWRAENPELISGENSAEALLERIKAEKAAQKTKKPATRKCGKKPAQEKLSL